jgi:MFS family permease
MMVDTSASDADLGTYTGLYYIASQLAAVAGPTINGYIVEWGGGDYNLIFVVTPAFFVLAILCMLGVTKGEAKENKSTETLRKPAWGCNHPGRSLVTPGRSQGRVIAVVLLSKSHRGQFADIHLNPGLHRLLSFFQ